MLNLSIIDEYDDDNPDDAEPLGVNSACSGGSGRCALTRGLCCRLGGGLSGGGRGDSLWTAHAEISALEVTMALNILRYMYTIVDSIDWEKRYKGAIFENFVPG